ncbi:YdeI/OmpD-associated family protein [Vagococcus sp. BWB3-3]|uniref:YdeI/OmpD-associated family protein n=2 Tax=Vagococcus allomyrinae TaxID=2794353 RepID=A0A940PEE4_9ENTE|nr:YdeI/OmpD-associated family protein [Vagococcus allomyrinae]
MVKLDETFTIIGLKFTPIRKKIATSQKVADYTSFVSHLQQQLQAEPTLLTLFETLAPGYQRNWARYVFSAKQQATQTKRFEEMKKILALGYKSKELYLQAQRG